MRDGWRVFPSRLNSTERRVYRAVTFVFVAVFVAFMWPVYPIFARARPLVLGIPLSLFYLVTLLAISFASLLALYRWEDRRGDLGESVDPEPGRDPRSPLGRSAPRFHEEPYDPEASSPPRGGN